MDRSSYLVYQLVHTVHILRIRRVQRLNWRRVHEICQAKCSPLPSRSHPCQPRASHWLFPINSIAFECVCWFLLRLPLFLGHKYIALLTATCVSSIHIFMALSVSECVCVCLCLCVCEHLLSTLDKFGENCFQPDFPLKSPANQQKTAMDAQWNLLTFFIVQIIISALRKRSKGK